MSRAFYLMNIDNEQLLNEAEYDVKNLYRSRIGLDE